MIMIIIYYLNSILSWFHVVPHLIHVSLGPFGFTPQTVLQGPLVRLISIHTARPNSKRTVLSRPVGQLGLPPPAHRKKTGCQHRASASTGVGTGEGVSPYPADYGFCGSVVSSSSGVRGEAPAKIQFCKIRMQKKPTGDTYFTKLSIQISP